MMGEAGGVTMHAQIAPGETAIAENAPVVTVVIPTYNRAHLVGRALRSALNQTFGSFEVVVVDDASSDDTVQVLESHADPRIRVMRLEQNRGGAAARNVGIEAARAPWVAFLDSDDEWLPGMLEALVARRRDASDPGVSAVYCSCWQQREGFAREAPTMQMPGDGDIFDRMLVLGRRPLSMSQCMIRRSALIEVGGFDVSLPSGQDVDIWLRIAAAGHRFAAVPDLLVVRHEHGGSQISRDPVAIVKTLRIFERRWGRLVRRRAGLEAYRRWLRRRLQLVEDVFFAPRLQRQTWNAWSVGWWYAWQRQRLLWLEFRREAWIALRAVIFAVAGPIGYARVVLPLWARIRRRVRRPESEIDQKTA